MKLVPFLHPYTCYQLFFLAGSHPSVNYVLKNISITSYLFNNCIFLALHYIPLLTLPSYLSRHAMLRRHVALIPHSSPRSLHLSLTSFPMPLLSSSLFPTAGVLSSSSISTLRHVPSASTALFGHHRTHYGDSGPHLGLRLPKHGTGVVVVRLPFAPSRSLFVDTVLFLCPPAVCRPPPSRLSPLSLPLRNILSPVTLSVLLFVPLKLSSLSVLPFRRSRPAWSIQSRHTRRWLVVLFRRRLPTPSLSLHSPLYHHHLFFFHLRSSRRRHHSSHAAAISLLAVDDCCRQTSA